LIILLGYQFNIIELNGIGKTEDTLRIHALSLKHRYVKIIWQKFESPKRQVSCQYLPIAVYCNLYKYCLYITTNQDVFFCEQIGRNSFLRG